MKLLRTRRMFALTAASALLMAGLVAPATATAAPAAAANVPSSGAVASAPVSTVAAIAPAQAPAMTGNLTAINGLGMTGAVAGLLSASQQEKMEGASYLSYSGINATVAYFPLKMSVYVYNPDQRTGYLQYRKSGSKKWTTEAKYKLSKNKLNTYTKTNIKISKPSRAGGTYYYRVYVPENAEYKSIYSREVKVVAKKITRTRTTPVNNMLTARGKTRVSVPVYVDKYTGGKVTLQRYYKKKWRTVSSKKMSYSSKAKWTTLKTLPTTTRTVKHRLVYAETATAKKAASRTFKVYTVSKYTSYTKKARNYMKKYCGSSSKAPIYINHPAMTASGGNAWPGSNVIAIRSGLSAKTLRGVARHECAHLLQFKRYGDGSMSSYNKKVKSIYGSNGFEKAADCMMAAWTGNPSEPWGYLNKCNSKQYSYGKSQLKALAKKPFYIVRK